MSDKEKDKDKDKEDLEEESSGGGKKSGGFLSPFLIKLLGGIAAVIFLIILMVIVSLLVVKCSGAGTGGAGRPDDGAVDIRKPKVEHPETLPLDKPFRQQLRDGKMIQLSISLGFKAKNKKLQTELTQNIPQIRDIIIKTLTRIDSGYFSEGDALEKLEQDLLKQINRILNEGEVEHIFFQEYTLMGN